MSNKLTMTLVETINTKHFDNIINNYEKLLHLGYLICSSKNDNEQVKQTDGLFTILHNYLNNLEKINENFGISKVDYVQPRNIKSKTYNGRLYPLNGLGVISFPRAIRNYLLCDNDLNPMYVDIDIKNAHPTIYYQYLLKEENYPPHKLEQFGNYINNRDQWIKNFGKDIKTPIISVINCCEKISYKPIKDETLNKQYEQLLQELWNTQKFLKKKYKFNTEQLKNFIYTKNTEIEKAIIDEAIHWTKKTTQAQVDIYCYDGFMVKRDSETTTGVSKNEHWNNEFYIDNMFLPFLSEKTHNKTGYKVEFVRKEIELNMKMIETINETDKTVQDLKRLENGIQVKLPLGQFLGDFINDNLFTNYPKKDIFVFKSAMGDGKTFKIYSDINNLRNDGSTITTISILNRISLTDNVRYDYPFTWSYRERKNDTKKIDEIGKSIIICCESLHRLTPRVQQSVDVLILDELMSLLPQLQTIKTHKENIETNQHYFIGLVKAAKKIVIMDANIDQNTIDYIKKIRGSTSEQVMSYEVEPRKEKNITFYEEDIQMIEVMCEKLKEGKKLFIPNTRAIDYGNGIIETLLKKGNPNSKCLYINSSTKDIYKNEIENTALWSNYDIVMISPTISCGVSYTQKDVFDEVFCFFTNISCNPLDSSQMIGRVRYPKTPNIHINVKLCHNNTYKYPNLNPKRVLKMMYQNIDDLYNLNHTQIEKTFNYETFSYEIVNNHRTDLFIHNYIKQNKVYSLFIFYLKDSLRNSYICSFKNINVFDEPINKELDQITKENFRNCKNQTALEIFKAQNINSIQAQALVDSQQHEQSKEYLKYLYRNNMALRTGEHLDKFIEDNIKNKDYRILKSYIDSKIIPTVKTINRLTTSSCITQSNLNPEFQHEHNKTNSVLQILSQPDDLVNPTYNFNEKATSFYDIQPYKISELKTNEHWDIIKSYKLKSLWIDRVMKHCFPEKYKYLFQTLTLTDDEIMEGYDKFKDFYKKHSNRLYDLDLVRTNIKNNSNILLVKEMFNKLMFNVGLVFRTLNSKRVMINGERSSTNEGNILVLIHPVILDERLPVKLETLKSNEKSTYKLTTDTIPIINYNLDNQDYNEEKVKTVFTEEHLQRYYDSVFYNLKY